MNNAELKKIIEDHLHWINEDCEGWQNLKADLFGADLRGANLREADLFGADLRGANLRGAKLDYSCLPLWWGSEANFDSRQLKQIAYHLVKAGLQSSNATDADRKELGKLIGYANEFHHAYEWGEIPFVD
mgnify:CR=1 FL=1